MVEDAAIGFRLEELGQVERGAGRELETAGLRAEVARVADGGHLDGGLGAVEEGVEHLGVEVGGLAGGQAVVVPHGVGRAGVVGGQVLGAFPRADDAEAGGAGPIDHFCDQGGLVAVGEAVDGAGLGGAVGEVGAGEDVGFDVDHDDVFLVLDCGEGVGDAGGGGAGAFEDHVDARCGDQGERVGRYCRLA